ncbi:fimbrial biogenesis chaperone [Haemophilus influenzae]|uniref:Chaperone protein HifB n=1 Tax=Haemophilus influenzae F3047 TaxID=935897 RepID=A0AAV2U4H8_HAEIF|nr:fimbria/pilus periplasmic chaperone [Haemophilus influenzae]QEQ58853.1 fimbria/pilus periplasmic chaperone [Haemophilus influenzae biotype aegyptius]CBY86963.1 Fimbrial protein [Haemophilus influenzae F3047]
MIRKFIPLLTILPFIAQANVVITGTRIIYPAEQKSITIQLTNVGESPALVQSWLDKGDIQSSPDSTQVPFIITPPITRIEANSGQSLRTTFTNTETLAKDRESLFYFNLLDIPPKPSADKLSQNPNYLQLAIKSRLKFFYRPSGLSISANDAYSKVIFSSNGTHLKVNNQTPYYITYAQIKVNNQLLKSPGMVAPYSQENYPFKGVKSGDKVDWTVVNDYGGDQLGHSRVQ